MVGTEPSLPVLLSRHRQAVFATHMCQAIMAKSNDIKQKAADLHGLVILILTTVTGKVTPS
jgi:hypothetical protein